MIVLAGKGSIAVQTLRELLTILPTSEVCVIPVKSDQSKHTWQPSLLKYARHRNVDVVTEKDVQKVNDLVFLSAEYDRIIKPELFSSDKLYNIHLSLLPKYKGMYTAIWPLLLGESCTGVTLHRIDAGIDTGPIVDQLEFNIPKSRNSRELLFENYHRGFSLLRVNLEKILNGQHLLTEQHQSSVSTYFSKSSLNFRDTSINFSDTAHSIVVKVKAFAFQEYQLLSFVNQGIVNAVVTEKRSVHKPGEITDLNDHSVEVSSVDYNVRLYFERRSALSHAVRNDDVDALKRLYSNLAYVDDPIDNDWSPLIIAAYSGSAKVTKFLLDNGANVNAVTGRGTSLLMYAKDFALEAGNTECFDMCVDYGAELDILDYTDRNLSSYLTPIERRTLGLS
jgi:methionyl-tRNA formyltransferase